jgi:hypothetical protein
MTLPVAGFMRRFLLQQPLALQKAPEPFGDGLRQFAQLGGGRRPQREKPLERSIGPGDIDPIQEQHVEVDVEVQRTDEALDQGHRAGTRPLASEPGLLEQMAGDGKIDDGTVPKLWPRGQFEPLEKLLLPEANTTARPSGSASREPSPGR